ncbi:MAG: flagellar motor switch protein FliN [Bryobacterales bacterium]|nr:flagellar motor switch protein FliN [Bryobacteraceae bacterium]MDW8130138.1 flagellar motor switch protein FliN [Bryobacterales bacterium]
MTDRSASQPRATLEWLTEALAQRLGEALELMTGETAQVAWTTSEAAPPPGETTWWRQGFSLQPAAEVWIGAPRASWSAIGAHVLAAAGIEAVSEADRKNTYYEILGQAFASMARALSERVGREISVEEGAESDPPDALEAGAVVELTLSDGAPLSLWLLFSKPLLEGLEQPAPEAMGGVVARQQEPGPPAREAPEEAPAPARTGGGRTLDLLLDVEMPVSVSFGRAQLALRDVLKLTTGSIIELNRTVNEPVEIIVNNCVIARGEVVVIEGNYGVRIQQIISRQERLRTLK